MKGDRPREIEEKKNFTKQTNIFKQQCQEVNIREKKLNLKKNFLLCLKKILVHEFKHIKFYL